MSVSTVVANMLVACLMAQGPPEPRMMAGRKLMVVGAVAHGIGGLSLGAAGVVNRSANHAYNEVAQAASPGNIGFPDTKYSDVADVDRRVARLNAATAGLAIAGAVLVIGGAVIFFVGAARHRQQRRVAFDGSGLTVRW